MQPPHIYYPEGLVIAMQAETGKSVREAIVDLFSAPPEDVDQIIASIMLIVHRIDEAPGDWKIGDVLKVTVGALIAGGMYVKDHPPGEAAS